MSDTESSTRREFTGRNLESSLDLPMRRGIYRQHPFDSIADPSFENYSGRPGDL